MNNLYYFHIYEKLPEDQWFPKDRFMITITAKKYFDKYECLDDQELSSAQDISILNLNHFDEESESAWSYNDVDVQDISIIDLKNKLRKLGLIQSNSFDAYMKTYI